MAQAPEARSSSSPALQRLLHSAVSLRLLEMRGADLYGLGALGAPVAADVGLRLMIEHNAVLYEDMRDTLALLRDEIQPHMQAYWPYMNGDKPTSWEADKVARYSELMATSQRFVIEELLASYDFSQHRCVMDVGGGQGGWISALGQHHTQLQLMLFDLPPVAALAPMELMKGALKAADAALASRGLIARAVLLRVEQGARALVIGA